MCDLEDAEQLITFNVVTTSISSGALVKPHDWIWINLDFQLCVRPTIRLALGSEYTPQATTTKNGQQPRSITTHRKYALAKSRLEPWHISTVETLVSHQPLHPHLIGGDGAAQGCRFGQWLGRLSTRTCVPVAYMIETRLWPA
jgi:hypothetical protein